MPSAAKIRPRRSVLYAPASNARAVEKARSLPCDVVILDLEDAVGPDAKDEARAAAVRAIGDGGFGDRELVVRVNGLDTEWGSADLAAIAHAGPAAVLAPKIRSAADVAAYAAAGAPLWLMIETCAGVLALDALGRASAQHGVTAWVLGVNDLAAEMGARAGRTALAPVLTLAVIAARANGLAILDAVFNDIADPGGLASECSQGRDLGFDGKTVIHPTQIAAANAAFSPDEAEIIWARTVVKAFDSPENAGKGVLKVDGRMVERLHRDAALRVVALSEAISAKDG
ncbi:HpcH/HpaI aldolase/citrate lyase family protein [Phenylobacterium immobile]|uniref:HpcH/HpaI aldolase/citrate lyase family protein n=1 Tax=Phenylobacterium immobile TaxID=21 RepID=UPI001FE17EC6|nr:CoA ester lyase [Phenylobacterium immobile]